MDFIDRFDTCQLLHISTSTLKRLVRRGILQAYHLEGSRKNYYSKIQITSMMRTKNSITYTEKHHFAPVGK